MIIIMVIICTIFDTFQLFEIIYISHLPDLDASLIAVLSNLPLGQRYLRMETNQSEIANQIKQLKPLGGKNLILMGSIENVVTYLLQAKTDMITKAFNWFIVTKVNVFYLL